jgi:tetratricopeptide (TPR) repeat protein
MEVLVIFIFPLFIYIALKIAIFRDIDYTEIDKRRHAEGIRLYELGFYNEALRYFDKKVVEDTKSMVVYAYRGMANQALKNYYQALYNFDKALALNHDIRLLFLYRAQCLYEIGDYELALKAVNKALWYLRDESIEAYNCKKNILLKLNKPEEVQKCADKIAKIQLQTASKNKKKYLLKKIFH